MQLSSKILIALLLMLGLANPALARLDTNEPGQETREAGTEQEQRHRELDEAYRKLMVERLELVADHQAALGELEQERALGADVDEAYRALMEARRKQDAKHSEAWRELDRRRAAIERAYALDATEGDVENNLAESRRP